MGLKDGAIQSMDLPASPPGFEAAANAAILHGHDSASGQFRWYPQPQALQNPYPGGTPVVWKNIFFFKLKLILFLIFNFTLDVKFLSSAIGYCY